MAWPHRPLELAAFETSPKIVPCSNELAARMAPLIAHNFAGMRNTLGMPLAPGGPWICGGSLMRTVLHGNWWTNDRGPTGADVDVFCKTFLQVEHLLDKHARCIRERSTWSVKIATPFGTLNVVTRPYVSLAAALLDFDYTVCQFGFDGEELYVGATTEADLAARVLVPVSVRSAERQFNRLAKYIAQGFTPTDAARDALFRAVQEGRLTAASEDGGRGYEFE